jgi:cell division protein FtsB
VTSTHKTSAIARPGTGDPRPRRSRWRRDHTVLDDLTRPIEPEHRLVTGRSNRWVLGLVALGIVGALLAALFVLPVQAWRRQQDEIAVKQHELDVLQQANQDLSADVQHLQTVEGAREAAREQLGVVDRGEQRVSVMPPAAGPLPLPGGWPYDAITQVVAVRTTPTSVAPPPTTVDPATSAPASAPAGDTATSVASSPATTAPAEQGPVSAIPPTVPPATSVAP